MDQGCNLVSASDFELRELAAEVSLPETCLDLGCAEALDAVPIPLDR